MSARLHNCPRCGPVIDDNRDSICCPGCGDDPESAKPDEPRDEAVVLVGRSLADMFKPSGPP